MRLILQTLRAAPHGDSPLDALLQTAGCEVLRAPRDEGDDAAQADLAGADVWLTAGLRSTDGDGLGLAICERLQMPYWLWEPDLRAAREQPGATAVNRAARILTSSNRAAEAWQRSVAAEKIACLAPFVDCAPFNAAYEIRARHRASFASRLQLDGESPWLVARLGQHAVDAAGFLARSVSRLVLLGWQLIVLLEPGAPGGIRAVLDGLPRERVRLWSGIDAADLPRLLVGCDLFLAPDGDARSIHTMLLAQAAGLPVVAARSADAEDRIVDGRTGRLTASRNVEDFANAAGFLLRHEPFRRTFAQAAREFAVGERDIRAAAATLRGLLAQPPQRAE